MLILPFYKTNIDLMRNIVYYIFKIDCFEVIVLENGRMKAAVFYGKHDLRIEEKDIPKAGVGEVLVKVMACGICGTDIHIFEGDEGAAQTPAGTVLGHEFSGIVTEIGEGVDSVKVGDRVCVDPNKLCGECYYCRKAIGYFCEKMIGIGTTVDGGFEEYCVVPKSQVYKIAADTSFDEAAMTEPVSCCIHGIDLCDIKTDDTVLIIGCGMIGLIMLQLAKNAGAARVIAIEPQKEKREFALELGADEAISPSDDVDKIFEKYGRITKVIECAGRSDTMEQAVHYAGNKAIVMFFGLTAPEDTIKIKPFEIFKKELEIKASFINPYTQQRAIEMIDAKKIDVSSMIYKRASLEELPQILEDCELRRKGKFIIHPNEA